MSKEKILTNTDDEDDDLQEEVVEQPIEKQEGEEREATLRTEEVDGEGSAEQVTDEEREARRLERQRKRERRRQAEAAAKAKIAQLETTVETLTKRLTATEHRSYAGDVERVDQTIAATRDFVNRANQALAAAVKAQDGEAVAQINEQLFNARTNLSNFEALKKRLTEETTHRVQRQQQPNSEQAPRITPQQRKYAQDWASKHDWYDPELKDHDSRVMNSLDQGLSDEGWDPSTPEYWEELTTLAKRYLPHRYSGKPNGGGRPSGGSAGGTGRGESGNGSDDVRSIPKQLVDDWKEAGIWGDPKRRAKALADYKRIQAEIKTGRAA